jgi:hypothetical protein
MTSISLRAYLLGLFLSVAMHHPSVANPVDPAPPDAVLATDQSTIQSLEALERSLAAKESELAALQSQLAAATDDLAREELRAQVVALRKDLDDQRRQFERFAVDIDLAPFIPATEPEKFDWQQKVNELLEPIMAEIESATAESRAIGELRGQLNEVGKRRDLAAEAVANLDALLQQSASPELTSRLTTRRAAWSRTLEDANNEFTALDLQLQSRLATRESVLDQSTKYARRFFQTRGLNLLLGILAFCAVFFAFRLVERLLHRARAASAKKSFSSRLSALLFHLFSVLGGLLAMMAVFNLVGDWFMLGIIVIFLIGVAWAGVNTLPQQIETIKLMLNIGAVKEGEALVVDGLPYRVESLGFAAKLVNPLLDGGTRILPVKYLVGQHSRAPGEHEAWFPCRTGDWVSLPDGVTGRVATQTPGHVTVIQPGGAQAVYPTTDFLARRPVNLSHGFRLESTIGVSYRHLAEATAAIPTTLTERLRTGLATLIPPEHLIDARVDFAAAGPSSLNLVATVDLHGAAAERERDLRFALQRLLVEACRDHDWEIPFPQLTIHRA